MHDQPSDPEAERDREVEREAIRLLWRLGYYTPPMPGLPPQIICGAIREAERILACKTQ